MAPGASSLVTPGFCSKMTSKTSMSWAAGALPNIGRRHLVARMASALPAWLGEQMKLPDGFNPQVYYRLNEDVRVSGMDAAQHYLNFGHSEGRPWSDTPHGKYYCVICNRAVDAWLPFHIAPSEFLLTIGSVGSNIERFFCPDCRSIDRERHLWLFFDKMGIFDTIRGASVLHMTPESTLATLVRAREPDRYIQGDLFPNDSAIEKIDLQDIPYADQSFDLAICNHTLEHVADPQHGLSELARVLKSGGRLICQTPYAAKMMKTLEEPLLQSAEDRLYLYGQNDHLRMFGLDIEQLILDAGFKGRLVPHDELLPDADPVRLGVNEREPFFDFTRA